LPTWDDLVAQVEWARGRGAAVHLDGARLWDVQPYYDRPLSEIAGLFDTAYVSFYKTLGGLTGCCLAGPEDLIAESREWRKRHGGTMHIRLRTTRDAFDAARARLADEGITTWSRSWPTDSPEHQVVELTVGDATLEFTPAEVAEVVARLTKA